MLLDWNIVDIHAHLLPGLDDGPADAQEALRMCRTYQAGGVSTVVATPHMADPRYEVCARDVREGVRGLRRLCRREAIRLEILPGADVCLQPEVLEDLDAGRILTLADAGRFLLIELPPQALPPLERLLPLLGEREVAPILTHPERHPVLCRNPGRLRRLVRQGCMVQITGASLLGDFGRAARRAAERFLKLGLVHAVASDAHAPDGMRGPDFAPVVVRLLALVGMDRTRELLCDGPAAMLAAWRRLARPPESGGASETERQVA
jgi:protein-tyrosine phosphatase